MGCHISVFFTLLPFFCNIVHNIETSHISAFIIQKLLIFLGVYLPDIIIYLYGSSPARILIIPCILKSFPVNLTSFQKKKHTSVHINAVILFVKHDQKILLLILSQSLHNLFKLSGNIIKRKVIQ